MQSEQQVKPLQPTTTPRDLLGVVYETIDNVRAKKMPANDANAINNLVRTGVGVIRLDIDLMKMTGQKPTADYLQLAAVRS